MSELEAYARHRHFVVTEIPPLIQDLLAKNPRASFLDLGCGDAPLLLALKAAQLIQQRKVWGVEGAKTRIARWSALLPEVEAICADVGQTNLEAESVDVLNCTQVIEHIGDQKRLLAEASRVLRPGGHLYLTTVFKKWYGWYFYRCRGRWTLDPTHLREYQSDGELLPDVEELGFDIVWEKKTPLYYPIFDLLAKGLGIQSVRMDSPLGRVLRRLRFPIPGYYNWEIYATRRSR